MTLAQIAEVTGGAVSGDASAIPTGVSIDSRTLSDGDLFFAIAGPNHDGHRFASDAVARGAAGLVVSNVSAMPRSSGPVGSGEDVPVLVVADTLRALQDLAAHVRRRLSVKVVAITGSAGKTTTKEMTRQALEAAFRVHASRGNLNNLYGCPLSLLELTDQDQVSVLEMGMSFAGELTRLAEIADPDIGVITNVSGAHLANFGSLDDVADAKAELFRGMRENSTGVFNNDDERCRRILDSFKGYGFTYGIDRPSDLTAADYRMEGLDGCTFEARHVHDGGSRRVRVRLRFVGLHHVYNALAAMGAGYMLGIDLEAMAGRLAELVPLGMRGRVLRLSGPVCVLDDCYNSNPAAMKMALKVLAQAEPPAPGGRRIVVFGDMLEQGSGEVEAHREMGGAIAASGAEVVITVGPLAAEALAETGLASREAGPGARRIETLSFESSAQAAGAAASLVRPGDLILVKGSRGVALEKVVAALRERFGEE